ncbi:hypothetical protein BGZ65_003653 [Modicella reniformis]|uniref:rhizopuspepsin n=1 Tax=Modicella reniformis TaxID=1440133 RepID=A0A9P6IKU6_9FUNG|nr:hypothetical protein BGZ65_003653 [Modicella reniformis]
MKITAYFSVAIATALALTQAAPTQNEEHLQGHKIPLMHNPEHKRDFKSAMAKLNHRYPQLKLRVKGPKRNSFRDIVNRGKGGTVPTTNYGPDYEYFGPIQVGSTGQTLKLLFDTGSSDIWFPSTDCNTDACMAHTRFDTQKSRTFKADSRTWEIKYGDGSTASGILGSDMVNVGGIKLRQTIGLALNQSVEFARAPEDGIFGLAFASLHTVSGVSTFMENAIATNSVVSPVVSAYLPSKRINGGEGGYYLFGGIEKDRYVGELTYVPVTKANYWQVHVSDLKFNGKSLGAYASEVIMDTGTTLIIVTDAAAQAVHEKIQGAVISKSEGGWVVPCSLRDATDTISFTLAGKDFLVPIADLAWDPLLDNSGFCYSGVQGGQKDGLWILGDMFVKNNYCVFDHNTDKPAIGIAPIKY